MGVKQIKVDANEVTVGMFVSRLDRPWTQTPFPLQGFYIRDLDEIKQLKAHCKWVYIDAEKGSGPVAVKLKKLAAKEKAQANVRSTKDMRVSFPIAPLKIKRDTYKVQAPLKKEVTKARQLHQKVYSAVEEVFEQIETSGDVAGTRRLASEMVDSVLRNPDAMSWLSRVKEADEHTYAHAVRSAVWAILFGRHLGMEKAHLDTLAMGVLLKDVGKIKIDSEILAKTGRTATETQAYERFVELGVEMLRESGDVSPKIIGVVKSHCERLNGSGFPGHLKGDKIPLLGKIAGIVTYYDDATNPRDRSHPQAPSKVVAQLYDLRHIAFQEELVVEFIRAIGLYPTGTVVELNTGEVGVVVEQNFGRRLKPKVMIVLDACKDPLGEPILIDLAEDEKRKQKMIDSGKLSVAEAEKIEIAQDLDPSSVDIDIAEIRDNYLFKNQGKGLLGLLGLK